MLAGQSQRTVASLGLPQALQDQLSAANYVYVDDLKGVRPSELARDLKGLDPRLLGKKILREFRP